VPTAIELKDWSGGRTERLAGRAAYAAPLKNVSGKDNFAPRENRPLALSRLINRPLAIPRPHESDANAGAG
jgi:hypothetical protein